MSIDERALEGLIEQSADVHSDAMKATQAPLAELVELGQDRRAGGGTDPDEIREFADNRRRLLGKGIFGAGALATGGFAAAILALMESPAFAADSMDVQMLQTAASIENLAIATYTTALTLDFIGGASAIPTVKAFVMKTKDQHGEHLAAFNSAVKTLGGKEQTNPDPVLKQVVDTAVPGLTGPAPVVDLALELENGAARTYVANVGALKDKNARIVTASIMGVEAQHAAVLSAVKALVAGGLTDEIALPPPDLAKLPSAAGSVGFPDEFFKTTDARPAAEGAVK